MWVGRQTPPLATTAAAAAKPASLKINTKNEPESSFDSVNDPVNEPENDPSPQKGSRNNTRKLVVEVLAAQPRLSIKQLSTQLNKSESTLKRVIKQLQTDGLLQRIGPDKGGLWKVVHTRPAKSYTPATTKPNKQAN